MESKTRTMGARGQLRYQIVLLYLVSMSCILSFGLTVTRSGKALFILGSYADLPALTPMPTPTTKQLYVNPEAQVNNFVSKYPALKTIAETPQAIWLGEWSGDVGATVKRHSSAAQSKNQAPVFVIYMILGRDVGGFSAGGSKSPDDYRRIIDAVAANLTPDTIIILEPDAIVLDAKDDATTQLHNQLIIDAGKRLMSAGASVYIDAGHPRWRTAEEMAKRLSAAGVANVTGFSLNTSNFVVTDMCLTYGKDISSRVGGKHFVIDTSRNGNPTMPAPWDYINPPTAKIGIQPTLQANDSLVDGFLWIKNPGESDGYGGAHPAQAGQFVPELALDMLKP